MRKMNRIFASLLLTFMMMISLTVTYALDDQNNDNLKVTSIREREYASITEAIQSANEG